MADPADAAPQIDDSSALSHRALVREVYGELAMLRRSGRVPDGLDGRLDAAFARVAPSAALQGDTAAALDHAESLSHLDPHGNAVGRSALGTVAKRLVRKATYWYAVWFTAQIADFGAAIARAGRLLERRVVALERGEPSSSHTAASLAALDPQPWSAAVIDAVADGLDGVSGVSFVGDVGAGQLLRLVAAVSDDVIAVDPRLDVTLADHVVPVRLSAVSDALAPVAPRSLGCAVLAGVVDTSSPESRVRLAQEAVDRLGPGGRLVVLSADPNAPGSGGIVERDLAGTAPFHPETWVHVLGPMLGDLQVRSLDGAYVVTGTRA